LKLQGGIGSQSFRNRNERDRSNRDTLKRSKIGAPTNPKRAGPARPDSTAVAFPQYTTRGSARVNVMRREILQPYIHKLDDDLSVEDNEAIFSCARNMSLYFGFGMTLDRAKCTFRKFVQLFPDKFAIDNNRITLIT
jgi:hypothetical protein